MNYVVDLEKFYGPLDLLLYLIEKDEMDIYDISIAGITDQYIQFIQATGQNDLDNMGDFLIMASYLLNLKSKMLLPRASQNEVEDEDELDPREELVRQLVEYKKYKQASMLLQNRLKEDQAQVFFRHGVEQVEKAPEQYVSNMNALSRAFYSLLESLPSEESYSLPKEDINVGDKMKEILFRLQICATTIVFQDLFVEATSRREAMALFLALLELVRIQQVEAIQQDRFGKIEICLRVAVDDVNER